MLSGCQLWKSAVLIRGGVRQDVYDAAGAAAAAGGGTDGLPAAAAAAPKPKIGRAARMEEMRRKAAPRGRVERF